MRFKIFLAFLLALVLLVPPISASAKSHKNGGKKISISATHKKHHKKKAVRKAALKRRSKHARAESNKTETVATRRRISYKLCGGITARSAIIIDADTNEINFAKEPYLPLQPASTIKIVTGLLALEKLDDNDPVRVSHYAESAPRQKAYLRRGSVYPAMDLIYATLLHSANDASRALAEKIAGSEEDFAKMMTKQAISLGAKKTVCRTASGLTAPGQATTAYDLAIMFNRAMQNEKFSNILKTRKVEIQGGKLVVNHNKALWQIEGAEGGKTGFTDAARKTYVGMFRRNNRVVVIAFLGSTNLWGDVRSLVNKAFSETKPVIHARNLERAVSSL